MDTINIDDFAKIEIKVGKILEAQKVEQSNKLLKLKVDFGNDDVRQVLSGIAKWYNPEDMIGKNFTFVVNLEYRNILDMESQAMILACHDKENDIVSALVPDKDVSFGSSVN